MSTESLENKIQRVGNPVRMLRESPAKRFKFPYPAEHTNWQDEQEAIHKTAVLFDQSHHMTDVYFRGPDVKRLLSDTGTNSFATYGRNRAKHFVTCNEDGHMIGTAVLFGLEEDQANLVGPAAAANWVQYQAEIGGYDVEVVRDERTADDNPQRLTFRYEIEGPTARQILEKAHGGPIEQVPFFRMTEFTVGGVPVRALSHTMAGVPGAETMGMEIWGPAAEGKRFLDALLSAGEEFGLVRGGALAYYTGSIESGYQAQPTAAVYTGERLKAYREWLPGNGYEGTLSVGGSFRSEDIEDYYVTPYDFGYGHLVRFDHDFIGRSALEQVADQPHKKKVWLRWHDEDVARVYASSLFGGENRAKYLDTPLARYARVQTDSVVIDGRLVGISNMCGYTVNAGAWLSVAMVDEADAQDGTAVSIIWGEENGGTAKQAVERHVQTSIRATVSTRPPVAH
ncbi:MULTISPECIES: aminomethyl transferase family protein [unclassified Modestobacter]